MAKHLFASYAPGFKTDVILDDGERIIVQFRNRSYETDNDQIAKQLDFHLEKRGGGRMFRRVDEAAALALVEQHKRSMVQSGAQQGPIASQQVSNAMTEAMKQRETELHNNAGLREQFGADGLLLTETVEQTRVQTVDKQPDAIVTDVADNPSPATTGIKIGKAGAG